MFLFGFANFSMMKRQLVNRQPHFSALKRQSIQSYNSHQLGQLGFHYSGLKAGQETPDSFTSQANHGQTHLKFLGNQAEPDDSSKKRKREAKEEDEVPTPKPPKVVKRVMVPGKDSSADNNSPNKDSSKIEVKVIDTGETSQQEINTPPVQTVPDKKLLHVGWQSARSKRDLDDDVRPEDMDIDDYLDEF